MILAVRRGFHADIDSTLALIFTIVKMIVVHIIRCLNVFQYTIYYNLTFLPMN